MGEFYHITYKSDGGTVKRGFLSFMALFDQFSAVNDINSVMINDRNAAQFLFPGRNLIGNDGWFIPLQTPAETLKGQRSSEVICPSAIHFKPRN